MNKRIITAVSILVTAILLITPCFAFAGNIGENTIKSAQYTFSDNGMDVQLSDVEGEEILLNTKEISVPGKAPKVMAVPLPSSFSLVSSGEVTSVKNQGSNGNCWAYSALASLESNYISNGFGTQYDTDFSESHLTWFTFHSYVSDNTSRVYGDGYTKPLSGKNSFSMGGNFMFATYTLAAGMGIATENNYPYVGTGVSYTASDRYVQSAVLSEMTRFSENDSESIKKALIDNGALTLDFCYKNNAYCSNSSYYYSGSTVAQANHAVTLVGWDDNYSASNFNSSMRPSGNGAWLCKNSWGTNDSNMDEGYFWISYEEPSLCDFASFTCEKSGSYKNVYQYDGFGYGSSFYSDNCTTAYAANVFTADADEYIEGTSFYTDQFNVDYTAYIYTDINANYALPTDGILAATVSGTEENPGYHKISFDSPVRIDKGEIFSVVIKYKANNDRCVYIPVEGSSIASYNVYYSSNVRNSYARFPEDPTQSTWFDTHNMSSNNVPIKVFTVDNHECSYTASVIDLPSGHYTLNACVLCEDSYASDIVASPDSDLSITLRNSALDIDVIVPAAQFVGKNVSLYAVRDTEYNPSRVIDKTEGNYSGGTLYYIALIIDGQIITNPGCSFSVKIASSASSLEGYALFGNRGAYTAFEKTNVLYADGKYVFNNATCGGFLLCRLTHPQQETTTTPTVVPETVIDNSNSNDSSSESSVSFADKIMAFFQKIADFFKSLFS